MNDKDKEAEAKAKAAKAAAERARENEDKTDDDAKTKPVELGSKDDFQLKQAIAHLKGEPVLGQPPKTVADAKASGNSGN